MKNLFKHKYSFLDRSNKSRWDILYYEDIVFLKREGRLVATKLKDNGDIQALDYSVVFNPSDCSMYSFRTVEFERRLSRKKYKQIRKRSMRQI